MIFFDTSALVPVFFLRHEHHHSSLALFASTKPQQRSCSLHSLAEMFNTFTRPSSGINLTTAQARDVLTEVKRSLTLVKMEAADYLAAVDALIDLRLSGPKIYDALLLQCARKVNAEAIYTWNAGEFRRLAPDLAARIRTP